MAVVYPNANSAAAHHKDTRRKVRHERDAVTRRAIQNLAATEHTPRITTKDYFPANITEEDGATDFHTILNAPDAFALEFGHAPSGFFAGTATKPPAAEYILTKAAIGGSPS